MLDIVTAIECVGKISSGGSTYPWVINVVDRYKDLQPYVVKFFTTKQVNQACAVAKEVYGNILAQLFEFTSASSSTGGH
jgi:hypothetical protein